MLNRILSSPSTSVPLPHTQEHPWAWRDCRIALAPKPTTVMRDGDSRYALPGAGDKEREGDGVGRVQCLPQDSTVWESYRTVAFHSIVVTTMGRAGMDCRKQATESGREVGRGGGTEGCLGVHRRCPEG